MAKSISRRDPHGTPRQKAYKNQAKREFIDEIANSSIYKYLKCKYKLLNLKSLKTRAENAHVVAYFLCVQ